MIENKYVSVYKDSKFKFNHNPVLLLTVDEWLGWYGSTSFYAVTVSDGDTIAQIRLGLIRSSEDDKWYRNKLKNVPAEYTEDNEDEW